MHVILVMGIVTPCYSASLKFMRDNIVTMPIENSYATVELDGQRVALLVDSGSDKLLVNSGEWYEEIYGKGACTDSKAACYFCPSPEQCYSDTSRVYRSRFADGAEARYVIHKASLTIGEQTAIEEFEFGIIIDFIDPAGGSNSRSLGILGIAPACSRKLLSSFIEQLQSSSTIARRTFAIHAKRGRGFNGEVTFGALVKEDVRTTLSRMAYCYKNGWGRVSVWTASVALLRTDGNLSNVYRPLMSQRDRSYLSYVDSGTISIGIPNAADLIERILESTKREMGKFSEQYWKVEETGEKYLIIDKRMRKYLPTLAFRLQNEVGFSLKIEGRDYTVCGRGGCFVRIRDSGLKDRILFGIPLFRAYDVHVDFDERKIGFVRNKIFKP